ncbi:TIR domain-containing protein [Streptomyces antimycoticus]
MSYAGVERTWAEWVAWHLQQHGFSVEFDLLGVLSDGEFARAP